LRSLSDLYARALYSSELIPPAAPQPPFDNQIRRTLDQPSFERPAVRTALRPLLTAVFSLGGFRTPAHLVDSKSAARQDPQCAGPVANAFWIATGISEIVVFCELWAIAWVRARFKDTPFLRAAFATAVVAVVAYGRYLIGYLHRRKVLEDYLGDEYAGKRSSADKGPELLYILWAHLVCLKKICSRPHSAISADGLCEFLRTVIGFRREYDLGSRYVDRRRRPLRTRLA
jgi:hypothetical protein